MRVMGARPSVVVVVVVVVVVYKFSQSRDTFSRSGLLKSNTSNASIAQLVERPL